MSNVLGENILTGNLTPLKLNTFLKVIQSTARNCHYWTEFDFDLSYPVVAVEWVVLMHIAEVPGSNLGSRTGYPMRFFVAFLSPSKRKQNKARTLNETDLFLSHP